MTAATPLLELDRVGINLRTGGGIVSATRDVSFKVGAAERIGIVGESGSGKSTVARAIMRLIDPTAGKVTVAGTEIAQLSRRQLQPHRKHAGRVTRSPVQLSTRVHRLKQLSDSLMQT